MESREQKLAIQKKIFAKEEETVKHAVLTTLLLLIFGVIFIGCYTTVTTETPIEIYSGPQTVEGIMEAFDERYNSLARKIKWSTTSETVHTSKRQIAFTLADIDAKYPRVEWFQRVLNKGIAIENFKDYKAYLNIRADLILDEFHTNDALKTFSEIHIDPQFEKYLREHKLANEAKRTDPAMKDWIIIGEKAHPKIPGRIYLQQTGSQTHVWHMTTSTKTPKNGEVISTKSPELTEDQKMELVDSGVEPDGWEVVYLDEKGNPIHRENGTNHK